jgi:hypothetical protein
MLDAINLARMNYNRRREEGKKHEEDEDNPRTRHNKDGSEDNRAYRLGYSIFKSLGLDRKFENLKKSKRKASCGY